DPLPSEVTSSLAAGAPVELAPLHLCETDRGAADTAGLARAAVHVMTVRDGLEHRLLRLPAQLRPRHDDAGLDADRQQAAPVVPQLPQLLLAQVDGGRVRVDAGAEEHLCPVDVADPGDHRLVHAQRADGRAAVCGLRVEPGPAAPLPVD